MTPRAGHRTGPHPADRRAGHRTRPHTADMVVEAWAPTRDLCFAQAVAALTGSFADTTGVVPSGTHTFRLAEGSDEQTLVAVLEEVIYLLDAHGQVPVAAHLDEALQEGSFDVAGAGGVVFHGSAPKGVARSGLRFEQVSSGAWFCAATIDV